MDTFPAHLMVKARICGYSWKPRMAGTSQGRTGQAHCYSYGSSLVNSSWPPTSLSLSHMVSGFGIFYTALYASCFLSELNYFILL